MQVIETGIKGLVELIPNILSDDRGWFYEFFKKTTFEEKGVPSDFVQENQSFSKKGVVRGLHLQREPYSQAKLVSTLVGEVLDVVVDLRKDSNTFKQVYYCKLDSKRRNMLYVPEGFAHGFSALEDSLFDYKCSNYYNKPSETGIVWDDPELQIDWQVEIPIVSQKDLELPTLKEFLSTY